MFRALVRGALTLAVATSLGAQVQPPRSANPPASAQATPAGDPLEQSGQNVTISLLTAGHGEKVWELFGHNAIWIHDNVTGRDTVFNWGVFNFNQPNFLVRYLRGDRLYAMGGDSLQWIPLVYRYLNRYVYSQELDLTAAEKDSVLKQIRWYARPENINYRYDDFKDNCSTRLRDILDNALRGQMRAQAGALTGTTYRWHALRLMQGNKPIVLGVNIGLGRPADRELTKWEEMFLPRKLHDFVGSLEVRDSTGKTRKLVRSEQVIYEATRPPEHTRPPTMWPWLLGAGVIIAGLFAWLGASGRRRAAAIAFTTWSVIAGLLGLVLMLLWTVTNHYAAHSNENLLLFNPLSLIVAVPLAKSLWSGRESPWANRLTMMLAAFAVAALLAHVIRLSAQDNLAITALAVPPTLAIAWVVHRARSVPSRR